MKVGHSDLGSLAMSLQCQFKGGEQRDFVLSFGWNRPPLCESDVLAVVGDAEEGISAHVELSEFPMASCASPGKSPM